MNGYIKYINTSEIMDSVKKDFNEYCRSVNEASYLALTREGATGFHDGWLSAFIFMMSWMQENEPGMEINWSELSSVSSTECEKEMHSRYDLYSLELNRKRKLKELETNRNDDD